MRYSHFHAQEIGRPKLTRCIFDFCSYGLLFKLEKSKCGERRRDEFFACNRISFCHPLFLTRRGLCVWVTLPRLTLLSVEPGRKAGRRFDSSPFRHFFIGISLKIAGQQCLCSSSSK